MCSIRPLHQELQQKAEIEINEVPSRVQKDLEYIKEWLVKQPHLRTRTDDQWILAFLRCCKFSLQRTKEKLDLFYTTKTLLPEYFANRDPLLPEIQECLQKGVIVWLPKAKDVTKPRITITRLKYTDADIITPVTVTKMLSMIVDTLLIEDDTFTIAGIEAIVDLQSISYQSVILFTPPVIKKWVLIMQNAYPMRMQKIYIINAPSYVDTVFTIFKSFLSEKLQKRLFYYKDNNLNDVIPVSILPKEYGGEGSSMDELTKEIKRKVESYRNWFLEDVDYCSIEAKRPGEPKTSADMFGMEGSFRQLSID